MFTTDLKNNNFKKNSEENREYCEESSSILQRKPFVILVTGGAASGKTTLVKKIKEKFKQFQQREILTISTDSYYSYSPLLFQSRNPIPDQITLWEELNKDLESLLSGKSIHQPIYDDSVEKNFSRSDNLISSSPIIIVEGMLSFWKEELRNISPLKIYLEVADEKRLARRLKRYQEGLNEGKFQKEIEFEKERFYQGRPRKNYEMYIEPVKKYADLIVNNDDDNSEENIEKIIWAIEAKLNELNLEKLENKLEILTDK